MSLGFTAATQGSISQALDTARIVKTMAMLKGVTQGTDRLKQGLRDDTEAAGLSERLARTWQSKVYPNNGRNPAGLVYSKAPKIMIAFSRGVTIYPTAGRRLLALPTADTPRKRQGAALSPREVEARFGRKLRLVPARSAQGSRVGGTKAVAYLVMDALAVRKSSGRYRNASARELKLEGRNTVRPVQSVVMFDLVAKVIEPKLLDLKARANQAGFDTAQLIEGALHE